MTAPSTVPCGIQQILAPFSTINIMKQSHLISTMLHQHQERYASINVKPRTPHAAYYINIKRGMDLSMLNPRTPHAPYYINIKRGMRLSMLNPKTPHALCYINVKRGMHLSMLTPGLPTHHATSTSREVCIYQC